MRVLLPVTLVGALLLVIFIGTMAIRSQLRTRSPADTPTVRSLSTVSVDELLDLPRLWPDSVPDKPLVALFVSSVHVCSETLNDVAEYTSLLERGFRPSPFAAYLLLESAPERARYFAATRDLNIPILFSTTGAIVDALYDVVGAPSGSDVDTFPPTLFLVHARSGAVLSSIPLGAAVSPPAHKIAQLAAIKPPPFPRHAIPKEKAR